MGKDIYEKNLTAMEKWYPSFADLIRKGEYERDCIEIKAEYSWDKALIFKVKKGNRSLYLNGKRNAREPVEIWSERIGKIHKYAPVFLLGLGSGRYLKRLLEDSDKTVAVVAYEPSLSIFLKMLEEEDLSEKILERPIAFIVEGLNGAEFKPVVEKLVSLETLEFLKQEMHPNYRELFPEQMLEAMKKISDRVDFVFANNKTGILFSTHSAKNQIMNMKYVCEGYNTKRLSEALPRDVPAILVSAGPSLDKNIQDIKKAKNRAFILAVDTAVKPLVKSGVLPDAFITIDSKKPTSLVEIDEIKDVPIIAPVVANYDILKEQRGKKIFYYDGRIIPFMAYHAAGKVFYDASTGGSVACSGFSLLYKMGFNTIILVGQDLAYSGNKSHAAGTYQQVMPREEMTGAIQVKGNYEEMVFTRQDFKLYLDWFNMYVKDIREYRGVRVINATEGGAFIENTEVMTLADAITETCCKTVDFASCIENMETEFTSEEKELVIKYIHTVPEELDEIRKEARNLQRAYRKIMNACKAGGIDKNAYLKQLKKIKKISEKCESKPSYELISATMELAEYVVRSESLYELDTMEEEGKAAAEQGMKYSKMLEQCAELLRNFARENLLSIK